MPIRQRITHGKPRIEVSGVGRKMLLYLKEHGLTEFQCFRNRGGFGAHHREGIATFTGVYQSPEYFLQQKGLVEPSEGYGRFRLTEAGKRYQP